MNFKKFFLSKRGSEPDYLILVLIFSLTIFGLVMLSSASFELGKLKFNDSYYFLKHQIFYGLSLGIIGFFLTSKIYYQNYRRLSFWLLLLGIVFLSLVFTPLGNKTGGAERWLKLGPISFQPAEIIKLFFVIYLAAWLSSSKINRAKSFFSGFLLFLILLGAVVSLLVLEPTTSTAVIILGTSLAIYFLSGAKWRYIFLLVFLSLTAFAVIIYITPYRFARLQTFINPSSDTQGTAYHLNQALLAIGSGGLWGVGFSKSTLKTNFLPEPISDSIFAVIANELGFVGVAAVIITFFILIFRIFYLAYKAREQFAKLLLVGFGSLIFIQSFMNIGAISGFLPLTGVPLPFISYGGTALAVFLTMGGIIINISKYI